MKLLPIKRGQVFGRWTVIRRTPPPETSYRITCAYYLCKCHCGRRRAIKGFDLVRGRVSQCRSCAQKARVETFAIGTTFRQWTVTGHPKADKGAQFYPCICACGNKRMVRGSYLRTGISSRCHVCAARTNHKVVDITSKTFGGWLVVKRIPHTEREYSTRAWLCRCIICGVTELPFSRSYIERSYVGCFACASKARGIKQRLRPYESLFNWMKHMVSKTKHTFTLTYAQFAFVVTEHHMCHYCHTPLTWAAHNTGANGHSYKLDRVDNTRGYEISNLVVACWRCNSGKGNRYSFKEWYTMTECYRIGVLTPSPEQHRTLKRNTDKQHT